MSLVTATIRRDLLPAARNPGEWLNPLMCLQWWRRCSRWLPGSGSNVLGKIAGGVIWVLRCWQRYYRWMLCTKPMSTMARWSSGWPPENRVGRAPCRCVCKALRTGTSGLPLTLIAPVLGLMLALPEDAYWALIPQSGGGNSGCSSVGAVGAAHSGCSQWWLVTQPADFTAVYSGSDFCCQCVYHAGIGGMA